MLNLRPKGHGASLDTFGWACDGVLVNATRGFAMVALTMFIVGQWQHEVPTVVVDLRSDMKVTYMKFT